MLFREKKNSKFISFCIESLLAEVFFLLLGNDIIELIPGNKKLFFSPFIDMHRDFRGIVPRNTSSKSLELFDLIVTNHDLVRSRVQWCTLAWMVL